MVEARAKTTLSAARLMSRASLMVLTGALLATLPVNPVAWAQIGAATSDSSRDLDLAPDSPFQDPDLFYLEADEVISDEENGILTAIGEVEGRYEDRTLRAERVDYDLNTGVVLASGNVVLIEAGGNLQYADRIELSDRLEAGTATNFTARLASGANTAARFVARDEQGEMEFYSVVYTACEICRDSEGDVKKPTWQVKARRLRQDKDSRTIRYRDAVLEVFGIPVFYSPYLAHPDPTQDRASGLLFPILNLSQARGAGYGQPYYWAIDDYSELTITPRLYSQVNPLLSVTGRRKFATGEVSMDSSITYGTPFDDDGNPLDDPSLFEDPANAEDGAQVSGHLFLDGYFKPSNEWHYGYTAMYQTDDAYRDRYGLRNRFRSSGLIQDQPRTNTSQAFLAGQGNNYRFSIYAAQFQSLSSQIVRNPTTNLLRVGADIDDQLPVIAPVINGEYYINDPLVGGRVRAFGNLSYLTRQDGNDYGRGSVGAEYAKTWIVPGGLEVKPFAWGRIDNYDLQTENDTPISFSRGIGQAGVDMRYPFVRYGKNVNFIIEPRIQLTQSFGDAELENFIDPVDGLSVLEDGSSPDLDGALLFENNKADGFDFFEEGRRVDVGASISAHWTMNNRDSYVSLFGGRSFADEVTNPFGRQSGLADDEPDYIAEVGLNLGGWVDGRTLFRYDPQAGDISRIDAELRFNVWKLRGVTRYYRLNDNTADALLEDDAVQEVVTGGLAFRPSNSWSARYNVSYDLGRGELRTQRGALRWEDDCTLLELFVRRNNSTNILINDTEVGFSIALKTLGAFGVQ
ncbi:MAG: LPS assembly protein LptD [Pseudomonadota bacterium]